jgi:hypothetical protein
MKTSRCVSIDADLFEEAQKRGLCISECCEEGLRNALNSDLNPVEAAKSVMSCLTQQDKCIIANAIKANDTRALRAWSRVIFKRTGDTLTPGTIKKAFISVGLSL